MRNADVNTITRVGDDGDIQVYFSAKDLSTWFRSEMHAEINRPILEAIADMIDSCALDAVLESVDYEAEG